MNNRLDQVVFKTARLLIRKATVSDDDIAFFYDLWTNPKVMSMVGFPHGLKITKQQIHDNIAAEGKTEYEGKLLVVFKESGLPIGECKLGPPDETGISETDVKLLPLYWGQGFGTELKHGLVNYLFCNTDCKAVLATPNKLNVTSQKMQEAVGGKKIREGIYRFPKEMRDYTTDVPHFVYMVFREDWQQQREKH